VFPTPAPLPLPLPLPALALALALRLALALALALPNPLQHRLVTTLRRLTWNKQKYVTVTLEKKFPPYLGWRRTNTGSLDPRRRGSARTCSLHCTLTLAACAARSAQRDPLRDETREVGRGLSIADTQTGRYGRLYSRRRLCARRGADARLLLRILLELVQLLATSASPRAKSLIPIPVPVQYRLSRCLE
jgi:hypothetical protein